MNTIQQQLNEQPLEAISKAFKGEINVISSISKSKLDKAQARRLKMPKRNRSAYFLFSMDTRAKIKAESPVQLTPLEMQAKVSQYWKELSFDEKQKYEQRAKEEKLQYLANMERFYSTLTPETIAKSQTNRPKKPMSAYAHFVKDIKTDLKKENPRLIMQEILHIASDKWRCLAKETRVMYEERAKIDKEQYMAETGRLNLSDSDSPKNRKKQSSESSKNKSKRGYESMEDNYEEEVTKQVKVEAFPVKSESQENLEEPACIYVKHEEYKELSHVSESPIAIKSDIKMEQDLNANKLNLGLVYNSMVPAPMMMNGYSPQSQLENLKLNDLLLQRMNASQNMQISYDRMQEMINARVNYARAVQTNRSIEQEIMRRLNEVKNLQAQRFMVAREAYFASNYGTF